MWETIVPASGWVSVVEFELEASLGEFACGDALRHEVNEKNRLHAVDLETQTRREEVEGESRYNRNMLQP